MRKFHKKQASDAEMNHDVADVTHVQWRKSLLSQVL